MKAEAGTVCRCQSKLCGCEVLIKQLAPVGLEGTVCRCFCGTAMKRPYERPSVLKSKTIVACLLWIPPQHRDVALNPLRATGRAGMVLRRPHSRRRAQRESALTTSPKRSTARNHSSKKCRVLWTAGKTTTKDYWGFLMSALACSMLPLTSSVFTSDFCPAWSVTSVSKLL
jgi:hypothetical protein